MCKCCWLKETVVRRYGQRGNLNVQVKNDRARMQIDTLRVAAELVGLVLLGGTVVVVAARVLMHVVISLRPMHMPRRLIRPMRMMPAAAEQNMQAEGSGRDEGEDVTHEICSLSSVLRGEGWGEGLTCE